MTQENVWISLNNLVNIFHNILYGYCWKSSKFAYSYTVSIEKAFNDSSAMLWENTIFHFFWMRNKKLIVLNISNNYF
jgi:hypothetical protein